ncbi:hypothetical protein OBV_01050 [Oscillibacter valericigenes Sjm18-20]|nr:hypothetical protein OBV_01050 [Oscillibacter valericigenes Sjm18-20]
MENSAKTVAWQGKQQIPRKRLFFKTRFGKRFRLAEMLTNLDFIIASAYIL